MEPSETDNPWGFTVVLDPVPAASASIYGDTVLSFSERIPVQTKDPVPDRIGEMRSLYEYENGSFQLKCKNFYRQGVFMQDYEDTAPWTGEFICYFPTYRDLTLRQLRGYFSWRTLIRKGEYHPIPTSAAYLYVYELLNGIGAASPEESVIKLAEFEAGYVESGVGDKRMQKNIHRWMLDFAVLHDLSPDFTRRYATPDLLQEDKALITLRDPAGYTDEEVFDALCTLGGEKLFDSPLFPGMRQKGNISSVKSGELLFFLIAAAEEICLLLALESWRHINGIPWPTQSTIRGKNLPIETMNLMNVADIIAAMGSGQWKDMKVSISTGNGFSPFSMRQTVSFATI